jgi:hypothetical protein
VLQWLTLGLALLAGAILLPSSSLFGTSGYGGYGQVFLMVLVLGGSVLTGLAGLVVGVVAMRKGTLFSSLWLGFALDLLVLGLLVALVSRL